MQADAGVFQRKRQRAVIAHRHGKRHGTTIDALKRDLKIVFALGIIGARSIQHETAGLDPALADTLVRAVGRATALEMVLEGRILDAGEALSRGIITRVVETADLDAEIAATVERVLAGAPLAQRYNRMAIRNIEPAAAITDEDRVRAASYADSEDYNTAWTSFLAKRKAEFKGR